MFMVGVHIQAIAIFKLNKTTAMKAIRPNALRSTIQANIIEVFFDIAQNKYDTAWHKREIKKREKALIKLKKKYNDLQDLLKTKTK